MGLFQSPFSANVPHSPADLDLPGSSSVAEFFRIMTRQFTEHEWTVIQSAGSEVQQLAAFYRHWVGMATLLSDPRLVFMLYLCACRENTYYTCMCP